VDMGPADRVRSLVGELLDVHRALRGDHGQERAGAPVERDRAVELVCDVHQLLAEHSRHRRALEALGEHALGGGGGLVRRARHDDPTSPAPATGLHLHLHDRTAPQLLRGTSRLVSGASHDPAWRRDPVIPEQLLPLMLVEVHAYVPAFAVLPSPRRSRSHATISVVGAPGVKIFSIPASASFGMSSFGMMPPPNTTTSPAPCWRRSSTTLGNSVMCAPEWQESPTPSASSWIVASTICSGVWWSPV